MHTPPPLLTGHHHHHSTHNQHNHFVCPSRLLHEMLSSVDAKLSEALQQPAAPGAAGAVTEEESREGDDALSSNDLLFRCAQAVSRHDEEQSLRILRSLAGRVSNQGDSGERVALYFGRALASRVLRDPERLSAPGGGSGEEGEGLEEQPSTSISDPAPVSIIPSMFRIPEAPSRGELHAAYLALNRVAPFLRFAHLTANQAIVEVMEGEEAVHLVDFDVMQGVQWPPLMQALAEREGGPPHLRLTGIGPAGDILQQTGNRLAEFARSLGLPFEYTPLVVDSIEAVTVEMLNKREGEAFALNCVLPLHRLMAKGPAALDAFLETIYSLTPKVFSLAEREASHNQQLFLDRFTEAFQHYTALFDSLEATLPPRSFDRIKVEDVWFGREIANIVSSDGSQWTERHQRFEQWRATMQRAGFQPLPPSMFARAQAKLLLRLHYPSEGYRLFETDDCLLMGWQEQALFSVSSWERQVRHD